MEYNVIKSFLKGKHNQDDCEDGIVLTDNFVAVIDGSTAKSDFTFGGKKPGRMAMEIISDAIRELPSDVDIAAAVYMITKRIHDFYVANNLLEYVTENPINRFTASAVILSVSRREVWMIGDCQCLIDGCYFDNVKSIDAVMAEARAIYNEVMLLNGSTVDSLMQDDEGRGFILPFLQKQAVLKNNTDSALGYSVFDGFTVAMDKVKVISVDAAENIVLSSDGYPYLYSTLEASENKLQAVLANDPLLIKEFKATKGLKRGNVSFDDRAYLSVKMHK